MKDLKEFVNEALNEARLAKATEGMHFSERDSQGHYIDFRVLNDKEVELIGSYVGDKGEAIIPSQAKYKNSL